MANQTVRSCLRSGWPLVRSSLGLATLLLSSCDNGPVGAKVVCDAAGAVTVGGQSTPVAPNGFAAVGNQIISAATCEPFRFVGISHPALSFAPDGGRLGVESTAAEDFARIRGWGANTVRIELAQYFWVESSRFYDPSHAERAERAVRLARRAGLHVILALQFSDRGDPNYPGDIYTTNMHQPMPDVNHSIPFWKEVAARFKDDGGILFELYSEPYPLGGKGGFSDWEVWLNGGMHQAEQVYEPRGAFQAAGMQQLYDAVRSVGAHNVVIVSGTQWGYFLDGVPTHRVRGYNIAYATHPWDYVHPETGEHARKPEDWDNDWAFLTRTDPVMITEFGGYDCTEGYTKAVLDRADQLGLSWTAWAWVAPGPDQSTREEGRGDPICEFPMLITDWEGTPSRTGRLVKARLASY